MLGPAHIVGISKTTYVPATPRCLDWRRDLQPTSTNNARRIRIRRLRVAGLLVVIAAIAAALGYQLPASSPSTAASPIDVPRREHRGALGEAGGAVPDGTTVFDDEIPGVANLDADLLGALRQAQPMPRTTGSSSSSTAAGVPRSTRNNSSARRSRSTAQKRRPPAGWPPPNTSAHVSGDAVDIGPSAAAAWLSEHGAEYGLCQIYGNEPWHYELRPEASDHGCPAHVRRPDARSKDAAVTQNDYGRWPPLPWSP